MTDEPTVHSSSLEEEVEVSEPLVRQLLRTQFPQWAELDLQPVDRRGSVNAMFRLGEGMVVRLTRTSRDCDVDYEVGWLTGLAPHLPVAIPEVLAVGGPEHGYPWHWSVLRWLEGETWDISRLEDPRGAAHEFAEFLHALQGIDPLSLLGRVPCDLEPLESSEPIAPWAGSAVVLHWDLFPGNVLIRDGRLVAVIDWAAVSYGDPARDLMAAWTLFSGDARREFMTAMGYDEATWARAHAWQAGHADG